MGYLKYYKRVNAQKQIDKLSKKYKDKKIIVYGAGIMSQLLFENYDVSKLNIVGVCDKKYDEEAGKFYNYNGIGIKELKNLKFDIVLILVLRETEITENLKDRILINTINENAIIEPFIKISFWQCIRALLG